MDLNQILQNNLSEGVIDQLSQQLGGADKQKTAVAASGVVSTLMGAMARNASTPEGAQSLNQALERDHDGSILDDLMGMVGNQGASAGANNRMLDGSGILGHVLGQRQKPATDVISKMSGLDSGQVGSLMTILAPVVMGMLGRKKRQDNLDSGGISDLLGGFVQQRKSADPGMGLVERFLDQDGDGDITDDVANIGMKMLGSFFKRR